MRTARLRRFFKRGEWCRRSIVIEPLDYRRRRWGGSWGLPFCKHPISRVAMTSIHPDNAEPCRAALSAPTLQGDQDVAAQSTRTLQDTFLTHLRDHRAEVTIFLVTGIRLQGYVKLACPMWVIRM
jgi:hypothetical protein